MHFEVYYVFYSQNSQNFYNMLRPKHVAKNFVIKIHHKHRVLFVGYLYITDLINAHKMEHIESSFEYYNPALTHVLSASSILPPNLCICSFIPGRKNFACISKT